MDMKRTFRPGGPTDRQIAAIHGDATPVPWALSWQLAEWKANVAWRAVQHASDLDRDPENPYALAGVRAAGREYLELRMATYDRRDCLMATIQ